MSDETSPPSARAPKELKSREPAAKLDKPAGDAPSQASAPKHRRFSEQEKAATLAWIETQVRESASPLKEAVKSVGISEQTYYLWKRAAKAAKHSAETTATPDSLTDLIQLETENQTLRKQLAQKLRSENAELRKRLGLNHPNS